MSYHDKLLAVTGDGWTTAGLDVQYKVEGKTLYLQCSNGASDWKHNFMFGEEVYKGGDIEVFAHRGFKALWLSVKDIIETLDFDTIVCYSQGAGIGVFAHENFYHRKGYQPWTYAFGAPRVLVNPCSELEARLTQYVRIKNRFDLVTLVPPMLMGYNHVGARRVLKNKAKRPKGENIFVWLSHHSPSRYEQNTRDL